MPLAASLFPHMLEQIRRTASAIIFNHIVFSGLKTSGERDKHICTEKSCIEKLFGQEDEIMGYIL